MARCSLDGLVKLPVPGLQAIDTSFYIVHGPMENDAVQWKFASFRAKSSLVKLVLSISHLLLLHASLKSCLLHCVYHACSLLYLNHN